MTHLKTSINGREEQSNSTVPGEKAAIDVEIGEAGESAGEETEADMEGTRGCCVEPIQKVNSWRKRNSKTRIRRSFIVCFVFSVSYNKMKNA